MVFVQPRVPRLLTNLGTPGVGYEKCYRLLVMPRGVSAIAGRVDVWVAVRVMRRRRVTAMTVVRTTGARIWRNPRLYWAIRKGANQAFAGNLLFVRKGDAFASQDANIIA